MPRIPSRKPDGSDVALGATTSAAVKTATTGTLIGHLRGLKELIIDKIITNIQIGGVAPQLDDTDKIAVSLYLKNAVAGDWPLGVFAPADMTFTRKSIPTLGMLQALGPVSNAIFPIYAINNPGVGITKNINWLEVLALQCARNGTETLDPIWNNTESTVLASAARTVETNSSDQVNYNGRGIIVVVNITAVAGSPSLVFTIQGKDPISGGYYPILASAAKTGTGMTVMKVWPGAVAVANLIANDLVGRTWRVNVVPGTADSVTYSVASVMVV